MKVAKIVKIEIKNQPKDKPVNLFTVTWLLGITFILLQTTPFEQGSISEKS